MYIRWQSYDYYLLFITRNAEFSLAMNKTAETANRRNDIQLDL